MKNWLKSKERLLAGTIIAGASAVGLAAPAAAQDEASAETEIVVTGSRIPRPNLVSVSPLTQITAEEITDRGVTRVEDMINQLPQAFAAQGANVSNGATGTATTDLRGLGANRTLVLINGRRMVGGDPVTSPVPDINAIPAALIERVELLTGGASAVYGADAVAGVVNFIMQDDFEGVRFDSQYSFYQADNSDDFTGDLADQQAALPQFYRVPDDNVVDGETFGFTAVFGANSEDGRGNATVYADYRNTKPVLQAERGYSACTFGENPTPPFFLCANGGSSTSFGLQMQPVIQAANYRRNQYQSFPGSFRRQIDPGTGNLVAGNSFLFNFGPQNYYQRPDERYSMGGFAHYEIHPRIEIYSEVMFKDDRSVAQIAPGGIFAGAGAGALRGNYPVNCDNPFLTSEMVDVLCHADAIFDAYDPADVGDDDGDGDLNWQEARLAAINALMASGDNPATPEDESTLAGAAAAIDGSIGVQQTCPDPDPATPGNQAVCVANLRVRNVFGEGRQADFRNSQYRFVLGARGELTDGWNYDVYGIYSTTIYQQHYLNEFSLSRVNKALVAYDLDPGPGQNLVCGVNVDADPANDDTACVPLNVFGTTSPGDAALAYASASGQQQGSLTLAMGSAAITGDLGTMGIRSPGAEDGVGVAFGLEARNEEVELRPDALFCPSNDDTVVSDLLGQGSTACPVDGGYSVIELFGEVNLPLIQDKPLFHSLGLDLGYRYSDYSISGGNEEQTAENSFTTDTYKLGGHWAPTEDIRFRGAYQRASRAPNIVELFLPRTVTLAGTTDPCAGPAPGATLAQCQNAGVTPSLYGFVEANPAAQYNGLLSGTPTLSPEIADTITVGFVFTPTFLSGLTVTADWYNIKIDERIGPLGTDTIINQCVATGDAFFCDRIHRDVSGSLWASADGYIIDPNTNAGALEVTGVDGEVNYRFDLGGAGSVGVNYLASYLSEYVITPAQAPSFDCAGMYGPICAGSIGGYGNPLPQYRHRLRVDWDTPLTGLSFTGTWRYYDSVDMDPASVAAFESAAGFTPLGELTLPAMDYFDIAAKWDARDNVTIRAGVNNVFEEEPPLTGASNCPTGPCSGNTWPQLYDALGRYVFFGVTADF